MVSIKRFGVLSVGVIFAMLYAVIGLFVGLVWAGMFAMISVFSGIFGSAITDGYTESALFGSFGWLFGGLIIVLAPVFYGALGFVYGVIAAALYNLFARWTGGIKLEMQQETGENA